MDVEQAANSSTSNPVHRSVTEDPEHASVRSSEDTTYRRANGPAANDEAVIEKDYVGSNSHLPHLAQNPIAPRRTHTINSQTEALLALPPPPSYDVQIQDLSIAVPPAQAYIPTPIPIPIPRIITDTLRKKEPQGENPLQDAADGLIVRNVTATIRHGEMCAIIGGSGSGKTTLLHAIASRLGNLPIASGEVVITPASTNAVSGPAGGHGKFKGLSKVLGFVRQNDYLLPHLTVRETLTYAAKLRLPSSVDAKTRQLIVEQTIQELGLAEAANTIVGGAGRKGISGGERRRLSIGCVLVSFPSVLVLDEVTTGLDSYTAYQLLETLDRLAKRGRTIVLSLHQPRSDAFALFSRILLLSHGSVVYSGLTTACLPYFANLGYTPDIQVNPLDFLIDISSVDTRDADVESESRDRLRKLVQTWKNSPIAEGRPLSEATGNNDRPSHDRHTTDNRSVDIVQKTMSGKRPGVLAQTRILIPRSINNMARGYPELIGHVLQGIALGTLMGVTFFDLKDNPSDIQSLKTLAFQIVPVYCYLTQVVWIFKWCTTLVVFDRERQDNLYNPAAWLASEFLAWLPVNIFAPTIFAVMTYFICNLRTDNLSYSLGVFIADVILVQLCFVAWALFAASLERSFARASLLGNALSIFFILSTGFFIVHVPGWIRWFRWISPYFFSFRIVVISQFKDRSFSCDGVSGAALAQCDGNNVLRGLRISSTQPLWPMFLGHVGFIVIVLGLSLILLTVWKPGGVRHAQRIASGAKGKEHTSAEIDLARAKVEVRAENVQLNFVRRLFPSWKKAETPILTNINAVFPPGEVTVIMGPSGSGKSTFLKMISGRPLNGGLLSSFVPSGKITLNGVPVSSKTRHVCAFVEQDDDYHMPALTVRETLRYAAIIKLPAHVSRKRKIARAEEVLKMLGLRDCADGVVGGELLKGISGGEKRRLSLACEMINDPAVLIVDEPTSGLDANTARNVMEALRDIARSGRTVIASLHQPRSDIYNMADNYMILAKRGNVVFQGPRDALLPHFALAGHECPPLYNPCDFSMDLVSVDVRGEKRQEESTSRINGLVAHWKAHESKIAELQAERNAQQGPPVELDEKQEKTPIWISLPVVLERSWKNTWRQGDLFWTRFVQAPVLAVCFFIFFLRLHRGATGAQDRIGLVAECTSALTFVGFLNLAALYPQEKTVFFHDYRGAGGRYSSATFIVAFSLFAILPELLSALLFAVIMNVATGMQTSARIYFEFSVAIWAQLSFGESVGIAFASWFSTMGLSVSLVSTFLTVASQASGVFSASVATFLADIAWAFPMKYASRILLQNEMTGLHFDCDQASIQSGVCTAVDGQQVLDLFGFHGSTAMMTGVMIAVTIAYRIAAWALLAWRMRYI